MIAVYAFLFVLCRELGEHAKDNGFPRSWGKWWNTDTAWTNKHRWGAILFPFLPAKVSKWVFFSPLVWVTDAEHLFQTLSTISVLLALLVSQGNLESVLYFYGGNVLAGLIKELTRSKTGIK